MTTRMVHPLHGWTHAYDDSEIESLKKNGWEVEVPQVPVTAQEAAHWIALPVLTEPPKRKYTRKAK